jgi:hypothetical protein
MPIFLTIDFLRKCLKTFVITTQSGLIASLSVGISPETLASRPTSITPSAECAKQAVLESISNTLKHPRITFKSHRNQDIKMNIRLTALSFLVAATCGMSLTQAAHAEDDDDRHVPSMRFDFAPNTYRIDGVRQRRGQVASAPASTVRSGSAPSNLFGLDPSLMSKATAMPVARSVVTQSQVSTKITSNSPFASLFNRPSTPIIAQGATPLAPIPWSPAKIHMPISGSHPRPVVATRAFGVKIPHHGQPVVAKTKGGAPIATYEAGKFYSQGDVRPGYSADGGIVTDASVSASVLKHKH